MIALGEKPKTILKKKIDSVERKLTGSLNVLTSKISSVVQPIEQNVYSATQFIHQKAIRLQITIREFQFALQLHSLPEN